MKYEYYTQEEYIPEKVEKMTTITVFLIVRNFKNLDKFVTGVVKVTKRVSDNRLYKIELGRTLNDSFSLAESADMHKLFNYQNNRQGVRDKNIKMILVTTDDTRYKKFSPYIVKPIVPNKMEDELINLYMSVRKIKGKNQNIRFQELGLGSGLMLTDGENTRLKIDYNEIQPATIAFMYALYYAQENRIEQMLDFIKG